MLVVHPNDETTRFLSILYSDRENCWCLDGKESRKELNHIFYKNTRENLLLLGHGNETGLFRKEDDGNYRLYIGKPMIYCLRRLIHPIVGVWCHSRLFAERYGLHGLFTDMIISELGEAIEYGVPTTEVELEKENRLFALTLAGLLNAGLPYSEIPARMKEAIADGPEVRAFNYKSFFVL